jgi:hypothetical protein
MADIEKFQAEADCNALLENYYGISVNDTRLADNEYG